MGGGTITGNIQESLYMHTGDAIGEIAASTGTPKEEKKKLKKLGVGDYEDSQYMLFRIRRPPVKPVP